MRMTRVGVIGTLIIMTTACTPLKPYEKEYLLDPTMDDLSTSRLSSSVDIYLQGQKERLGLGLSLGGETSCPTCGG
jgi:hypothetical protein